MKSEGSNFPEFKKFSLLKETETTTSDGTQPVPVIEQKEEHDQEIINMVEWLDKRCAFTDHQKDYVFFGLKDIYKKTLKRQPQSKLLTPQDEVTCPFCGEKGFDKIGLRNHLEVYCKTYKETEVL